MSTSRRRRRYSDASALDRAHDLDQGRAGAIEIDDGVAAQAVQVLARVFLHVHAHDADRVRRAGLADVERAAGAERRVVLADLVALGKIGVEVILASKDALCLHRTPEREPDTHGHANGLTVQHRQRAGQAEADGTHVGVRPGAERRGTAAERLGLGEKLGVDLEADHLFEFAGHG
jgi:hypothetical protein